VFRCCFDEFHVEHIQNVTFTFTDFELLNEWFKKYLYRNRLKSKKNLFEASQHIFSKFNDLMVFNEHESNFLVEDRSKRVLLTGKMI
jgi:hypothetical protein